VTYRPGTAFKPGNTLPCNPRIILRYYKARLYSTCSSQSHGVCLHALGAFLSFFHPVLDISKATGRIFSDLEPAMAVIILQDKENLIGIQNIKNRYLNPLNFD